MHGRGDHGAGHAEALGDVPLHLRAQHQFRLQGRDGGLDLKVVVGNQRLNAVQLGGGADLAGVFAAVGAEADDGEAELLVRHAGGGDGVGGVAVDEHPLAREIVAVHRARVPRHPRRCAGQGGRRVHAGQGGDFLHEVAGGANADGHDLRGGLAEGAGQPGGGDAGHFRIQHHVEVGIAQPRQVGRSRALGGGHVDVDAQLAQQPRDLHHVIPVAEAQRRRAEDVGPRTRAPLPLAARRGRVRPGAGADDLVEGLRRAPVLLLLVGRQLHRHHRHRQVQRAGEAAGVVLDQLRRAACAHQHQVGLEAVVGVAGGGLEQLRGVPAEVARLERGVGHGRAGLPALDHGEQQVGVGVALRRVQHVVDAPHRRRDSHGAHVRRAFVGP